MAESDDDLPREIAAGGYAPAGPLFTRMRALVGDARVDLNDSLPDDQDAPDDQILAAVIAWCGDVDRAHIWYATQILPGLGATAKRLVEAGRVDDVLAHLRRVADGGYA